MPARSTLLPALLLAACGAPGPRDPWPASAPPLRETVGWLDDRALTYGDVGRYLRTKDPEAFSRGLEGLVLERVTRAEAGPLGVTVPRGVVLRETERRMREWEARVRAASREHAGEEVDPALWLQRVAGVSVAELRGWVERHTEVELTQDRLLRYEMLSSPRIEVSMLLVEGEERARELAAEAAAGADFAALARAHSRHGSAEDGGRIPFPLLPEDLADAEVGRALFAAAPGAVAGPFATPGEGGLYQLYRVEAKGEARAGAYGALERDVARDLETRPVHVGEYERWRRRILLRHGFVAARPPGKTDDPAP